MKSLRSIVVVLLAAASLLSAQTVTVKFRYQPDGAYPRVNFPGSFNGWGPNSSGTIVAGTVSQADSLEASTGLWVKSIPIPFGTYQYKIYRQRSATASDWSWISDPLNRVVIAPDLNSQIVVDSLVLFQMLASPYLLEGTKLVVKSGTPSLTAGIFQPDGAPTPMVTLWMDGIVVPNAASLLNPADRILTYVPKDTLTNGMHIFKISVSAGGVTKTDSLVFEARIRPIQIQTPPLMTTRNSVYAMKCVVTRPIDSVLITTNGISRSVAVSGGMVTDNTPLGEGKNTITVAGAGDVDTVLVTRIVNHTPYARALVISGGSTLRFTASSSSDPDGEALTKFTWLDDPATPLGLSGQKGTIVTVPTPKLPGEYYYYLAAEDSAGHADTVRTYVIVKADGSYTNPTIASNPSWAKQARVYFMFPKGITQTGTLNAAALKLPYVKNLGFNVIWLMPIMKNASTINNNTGPGYNITDFYTVAPEYGTNQDFKNFMTQAHALGLKVILDVTPNHSSYMHPWVVDARAKKMRSPYWNWYQHVSIPHNMNGLGESVDPDGFYYYTNFSQQLLNLNWTDVDMQAEMINVYKYWVKEFGLDGYRFDVYWGPHRKYGEQYMGRPVRDALKHIKPDILLLAEDDGTGSGTETIYADQNGGVDAAYDFKLFFNQIRGYSFGGTSVSTLNYEMLNGGYFPGANSLYMRFMESQDEDRITYAYSAGGTIPAATVFQKTKPMATFIFTVPGFPMIWNGQEIGYGYGMSGTKENRTRTVINWNYEGKTVLVPHYQRLAWIRGTYPAFATQTILPMSTANAYVDGYTRPYQGENAIVLENFSGDAQTAAIPLESSGSSANVLGLENGKQYFMNDVYSDSSSVVTFTGGKATMNVTVPAYGSAIYILSDSLKRLALPVVTDVHTEGAGTTPIVYGLDQNYPNPFNPSTTIGFTLAAPGRVRIAVYDILGRKVAELVNGTFASGAHRVQWNASGLPSGMYLYAMTAGTYTSIKRMMVVK